MVKKARTKQRIWKSELSGEVTSMPWNKFACAGSINMASIAITSPSAATSVQKAVDAAVPAAARRGIAGDTPATAVPRLVVTPITRTTSAVKVTIASGAASLRRSRKDMGDSYYYKKFTR